MVRSGRIRPWAVLAALMALFTASCANVPPSPAPPTAVVGKPIGTPAAPAASLTPYQPVTSTPAPTPTQVADLTIWMTPNLPDLLVNSLSLPADLDRVDRPGPGSLILDATNQVPAGNVVAASSSWVYALAAPFPTTTDAIAFQDLLAAWQGEGGRPILMAPTTQAVFERLWGAAATGAVKVVPEQELVDTAWKDRASWAVVPFEALEPRWKVLRIDGQSPLDKDFQPELYPLTVVFTISGPPESVDRLSAMRESASNHLLAASNRDPARLTVLVMTGVTALVRATAWKMDTLGVLYPGRDIREWLIDADITHISNEVSFDLNCPPGNPSSASLRFCSRPEYIGLLNDVGADVIELTGNHMNDWGHGAFLYTLELYDKHSLKYFAGGENSESARQPLLVEHNGNRFAFIGCNPAGPPADWATDTTPGSASCDMEWMSGEISRLRSEGVLPIATFQYMESYQHVPLPGQQRDFREMAEAGAVIVSGSQAHFPQGFEFIQGNLIHYGLGNLFFDQIGPIINGVRLYGTEREFIDRHIFYEGRHLSTELLTAMLEDYARPRPMTAEERQSLLEDVFAASGW